MKDIRKKINTDKAPAAIGPYVQANIINNMIYTSGQIPLDPKSGEIVGDTIDVQTKQVLTNLREVVKAAGGSFDTVIKTTVFLSDMENFAKMNDIYSDFFNGENLPSRSAVEVARLPKDVLIEIEAVAYINE